MTHKQPKTQVQINISKTPKQIENPAQYKDFPISWQVSGIDDESRWGYSTLKNQVRFIAEKHFNQLSSGHDDLINTLIKLDGQNFASLDSMLEKIHRDSNSNITAEEQRCILKALEENVFWSQIFSKLEHFESHSWNDIEREQHGNKGKTKHHTVEVSKIIKEAQKRLEVLKLDDIEELFSIRLTGKIRIWGIRKYSHLRILWIDLEHEICPPKKD